MIGILSDAHGHRAAFDYAIQVLTAEGASRFVFLGDAVGYIPSPGVLGAIREMAGAIVCVRGNHEDVMLSAQFDAAREPVYQHARTRALLTPDDLATITGWPVRRQLDLPAGQALFVHGSPIDPINGYVYPDADLGALTTRADFVFMGHTHRPFIRRVGHTLFVNVGSCGLPRDRRGLGSAAMFNELTGDVRLVRFDLAALNAQLLAGGAAVHTTVQQALVAEGATPAPGESQ